MSSEFVRYAPEIETIDPGINELLAQIISSTSGHLGTEAQLGSGLGFAINYSMWTERTTAWMVRLVAAGASHRQVVARLFRPAAHPRGLVARNQGWGQGLPWVEGP